VATDAEFEKMVNLIVRHRPQPNGEVLLVARDVGCLARQRKGTSEFELKKRSK
jgi:hypothetical protein